MRGTRQIAGAAVTALILGAGAVGTMHAQQPAVFPMTVTQNRVPGAAGNVTMTPLGNGQARVDIRITGLPPNAERAAHIHTAPGAVCDNNSPVTYPLTNVRIDGAGVGTSTSTITITADKPVTAGNAYVNVHEAATPPGNGVICANVTTSFGAQTPAGTGMPRTGAGIAGITEQSGAMLALAALALTGGAGVLAVSRRRR